MISWHRIDELRQEVGDPDFEEIVALFLQEADDVVDRLRAQEPGSDPQEDLHFLKGSAMNLGFETVAEICAALEQSARHAPSSELDLEPVCRAYHASKSEFLSGLKSAKAG